MSKQKNLYRKSVLERLASVDQLDKTIVITSPLSWIALLSVTVVIALTLYWSVVGTLPSTVTAFTRSAMPLSTSRTSSG